MGCERRVRLTEAKSKKCDGMEFFNKLDSDLQSALRDQLRDLWTHTSTAIGGNTLTLGEAKFVI
jgi:hypothetical protein